MRGWSFPSNQEEEEEEEREEEIKSEEAALTSGVSISAKLVQMNQSLAFFEEQLQFERKCLEFQEKSPQDLNSSDIYDQESTMWDLSSSMSGMMAWAGAESLLESESLIALTSILRDGIAADHKSGDGWNRREEKLISGTTNSSLPPPQSILAPPEMELASEQVDQEVNGDDVVLEGENVKWRQIRGRAVSALFWLLKKISKSDNLRQL